MHLIVCFDAHVVLVIQVFYKVVFLLIINQILFGSDVFPCLCSKGSHSTKVEAVVRTLMRIQLRDPGAKALVFSTVQ